MPCVVIPSSTPDSIGGKVIGFEIQLYSQLVLHFVTGLFYVTDVAHNRNAASRFDYGQADKLCNDRFAGSPPLQVTTALV